MNEVATIPQAISPALLASVSKYLDSLGNKLTKSHREQFIEICSAFQLNPFIREVYGIPYGDKFNIIVGYEVYLKRAETSGQLAGWRAWTEGEGKNLKGCVEINRKDWSAPFRHEVDFLEYDQGNSMWKSKPRTMIKKVAIAQGFRMAFPVELGGMPYTSDEIPTGPTVEHKQLPPPKNDATEYITRAQGKQIMQDIDAAGLSTARLFERFGITRLGELPADKLPKVEKWIAENAVDTLTGEVPITDDGIEFQASPCPECGSALVDGACRLLTCPEARPE